MKLERIARYCRAGNKAVSFIAVVVILLMMSYGGFSLYDDWKMTHGDFESELMQFAPNEKNNYSLAQLMELNPEVRGWLKIDDTHINYPVLQGEDDMKYVNTDPLGEFSLSGSIFLSSVNDPDFQDAYSLVYGHHIENGAMFGDITRFLDEKYFDSHQKGSLQDGKGNFWTIDIFSVLETDASNQMAFDPNPWKTNAAGLISYLEQNAVHFKKDTVHPEDHIIGLSTCYDTRTNGRVLVFGKLTPAKAPSSKSDSTN